jgi:hypothetical protein
MWPIQKSAPIHWSKPSFRWCVNCTNLHLEPSYETIEGFETWYVKTLFYVSRIVREMKWLTNLQSFAYVERGFARFDTKVIHQICDRLFGIDMPHLQRIRIQLDAKPFEHAEFGSSILCPRRPIHLGGKLPLKVNQFCPLLTDVSGIQFSALTHLPNIENCSGYCASPNVSISLS